MDLPSQLLAFATKELAAGKLAGAEIACRELLDLEPRNAAALHLLGFIAAQVGMRDPALSYFQAALDSEPDNARIRENLAAVRKMPASSLPPGERYLLIKNWGFGFWADMVQVLGSLLLAEITGRIPVVYWGADSRFSDKSGRDAFSHYFAPVSAFTLQQLARLPNASFFPPRWNAGNLTQTGISQMGRQRLTRRRGLFPKPLRNRRRQRFPYRRGQYHALDSRLSSPARQIAGGDLPLPDGQISAASASYRRGL